MTWDDRGNSARAWDRAYAPGEHWDEIGGDAITEAFGRCLIENLSSEVDVFCRSSGVRVLDWGCGRGQITALLRERYPQATVAGMDFSRTAIDQARRRYGDPFIWRKGGEVYGEWNVVVSSNVLEHLLQPWDLLRNHLLHTTHYYVILTPHHEAMSAQAESMTPDQRFAAGHAHVQRFELEDFPRWLDRAERVQAEVVRPGAAWPGEQALVVYRCRR